MTALRQTYRDQIVAIMDRTLANEAAPLDAARDAIAAALRADRLIHVAGSGHSHLIALEVFYRAGGIAAAQALLDEDLMLHRGAERSTLLERESGRAAAVLARHRVSPGDVVIIVSNSGRNAYPVEFALQARAAGAVTIALTSRQHSTAVASRHTSGKRLFELADIVLDNGGVPGDAGLQIPGLQIPGLQISGLEVPSLEVPGDAGKMGPTSTIIGVWILNLLLAEAVAQLAAESISVDVWQSANADQGDNSAALIARWRTRLHGL